MRKKDKKLTPQEASDAYVALCLKYSAELEEISQCSFFDMQVLGYIQPSTTALQQALVAKIKKEERDKTCLTLVKNE